MHYEVPMRRYDTSIGDAIKTKNYNLIAAASGWTLEQICQNLSTDLQIGLSRKPNDKYTMGDLWPGIVKAFKHTNIFPLLESINACLNIRNLLGCHYNEWAAQLSDESVMEFAKYVQELYMKTFCTKCYSWLHKGDCNSIIAECNCHNLIFTRI